MESPPYDTETDLGDDLRSADTISRELDRINATPLAHALCSSLATHLGVRLLSIKGPSAAHWGLRPSRVSADADVLVEPKGFEVLSDALLARGWHERVARDTPTLIDNHSRTFIHDSWPCDIDVHQWFPGFFADSGIVFDALWKGRHAMIIGAVDVMIPSRPAAAAIAAMHALRNMTDGRHRQEWDWVAMALQQDFNEGERREFVSLANVGRARWVLRDLLIKIEDRETANDLTPDQSRAWQAHLDFAADGGAVSWWLALRRLPAHERIRFLRKALWVDRADIPRNDALVIPTRAEAWRYQTSRWSRGVAALRNYLWRKTQ